MTKSTFFGVKREFEKTLVGKVQKTLFMWALPLEWVGGISSVCAEMCVRNEVRSKHKSIVVCVSEKQTTE